MDAIHCGHDKSATFMTLSMLRLNMKRVTFHTLYVTHWCNTFWTNRKKCHFSNTFVDEHTLNTIKVSLLLLICDAMFFTLLYTLWSLTFLSHTFHNQISIFVQFIFNFLFSFIFKFLSFLLSFLLSLLSLPFLWNVHCLHRHFLLRLRPNPLPPPTQLHIPSNTLHKHRQPRTSRHFPI